MNQIINRTTVKRMPAFPSIQKYFKVNIVYLMSYFESSEYLNIIVPMSSGFAVGNCGILAGGVGI